MYLSEKLSIKGIWFVPSTPENRLAGELCYDPEAGSKLTLYGSFSDNLITIDDSQKVIIGLVEGSRYVTLFDTFQIRRESVTFRRDTELSTPICTYCVNFFALDCYVDSWDSLLVSSVKIHYRNLEEWVGVTGFEFDDLMEDCKKNEVDVKYVYREPISFSLPYEGVLARFLFTLQPFSYEVFPKSVHLEHSTYLLITSSQPKNLSDFQEYIYRMQALIIIALYQDTFVDLFEFQLERNEKWSRFYFHQGKRDIKPLRDFRRMLFTFQSVRDRFDKFVSDWFSLCDSLDNILPLFIDQFINESRFDANKFLNIAQAAESLHSILYNHLRLPKDEYKKKLNEIVTSVPEEHKDFVKKKLSQANALILAERLKELVDKCPDEIKQKYFPDEKTFINQIRDSRNYYTHYDRKGKKHILENRDLMLLTERIRLVIVCNILLHLKFLSNDLVKILENQQYIFIYLKQEKTNENSIINEQHAIQGPTKAVAPIMIIKNTEHTVFT